MIRRSLLAVLVLALGVSLTGCGGSSSSLPDMPVKTKQGKDKKGRETKSLEASLEEPPKK